jgi:hypothetical protein
VAANAAPDSIDRAIMRCWRSELCSRLSMYMVKHVSLATLTSSLRKIGEPDMKINSIAALGSVVHESVRLDSRTEQRVTNTNGSLGTC